MPYKMKKTDSKPHLIVDAGPGSGKTTTMIAGLNIMAGRKPSWFDLATAEQHAVWDAMSGSYSKIGIQAFNKSIATELQEKVPAGVEARTFHSFGNAILREHGFRFKISGDNVMYIVRDLMGYDKDQSMKRSDFELLQKVKKVVGLLKNNLLEPSAETITGVMIHDGMEINGDIGDITSLSKQVMDRNRSVSPGQFAWIDFDDMIWLPIVLDLALEDSAFDLLICDESQDLNPVQHQLVFRSAERLICVGDPRQAIYGFRGADANSMTTIEDHLRSTTRGVQVLPLQTSFRLPKSGVRNVNSFAPALRALDNADEGSITTIFSDEIQPSPGDLVVSRINANIFTLAFRLLRKRVAVRIQGREYGDVLKNIIKRECNAEDSIDAARAAIDSYNHRELERLSKKTFSEKLIDAHNEKITCLYFLSQGCQTVKEMLDVIDQLFGNEIPREQVVLLSTVHRAKGLESDQVFFLEPNLVPHPMAKQDHEIAQELNLKFVAETRHKKSLVYVLERRDEDCRDELECREMGVSHV